MPDLTECLKRIYKRRGERSLDGNLWSARTCPRFQSGVMSPQSTSLAANGGHCRSKKGRLNWRAIMRLWTLHPKYLDARGLVALWREALLAQKVLRGATRGYRYHPQLRRFSGLTNPPAALASYLAVVHEEAEKRGYMFDASKIGACRFRGKMAETRGQLVYEWRHLRRKLKGRDVKRYRDLLLIKIPAPHPLFRIVPGGVRDWEKVR